MGKISTTTSSGCPRSVSRRSCSEYEWKQQYVTEIHAECKEYKSKIPVQYHLYIERPQENKIILCMGLYSQLGSVFISSTLYLLIALITKRMLLPLETVLQHYLRRLCPFAYFFVSPSWTWKMSAQFKTPTWQTVKTIFTSFQVLRFWNSQCIKTDCANHLARQDCLAGATCNKHTDRNVMIIQ